MPNLVELGELTPIRVWEGVTARRVDGEQLTVAVVELEPGSVVPEHRHPNEQCGVVIRGEVTFRIADEVRTFGPGGTWRILADVPHEVRTGPDGAIVIDTFSPPRRDWDALQTAGSRDDPPPPVWPGDG